MTNGLWIRRDDIPLLVQHFIEKYNNLTGKRLKGITPEALDMLFGMDWPGNVRELENAIERAVVLATGDLVTASDLPGAKNGSGESASSSSNGGSESSAIHFRVGQSLADLEREAIQRTLNAVDGDKDAAARILGIGVATLYRRLKEMDEIEKA